MLFEIVVKVPDVFEEVSKLVLYVCGLYPHMLECQFLPTDLVTTGSTERMYTDPVDPSTRVS